MSETAHATLAASSAYRWLNCPASVTLTEHIEDDPSPFAAEGTLAHELGELKLRKHFFPMKKSDFDTQLAAIKADPIYKPEMMSCTDEYVSTVKKIVDQFDDFEVFLEQRVDYSAYAPGGFGTCDCLVIGKTDLNGILPADDPLSAPVYELHIIDYKNGKGVAVSADENPQLKLYALGALLKIQAEDELNALLDGTPPRQIDIIGLHIVQPRTPEGSSDFTLTKDELFAWAEDVVKPAAQIALEGTSEPCPGPWCTKGFCKIRSTCRARVKAVLAVMLDDRLLKEAKTLAPDEIAELLDLTEAIPQWRKGLLAEGFKLAKAGGLKGYKLVRGRSDRAWKDEKKAVQALKAAGVEDIMEPSVLRSPAQIEGLVGKERFRELADGLVQKPEGRETLVPESDRRTALDDVMDSLKEIEV